MESNNTFIHKIHDMSSIDNRGENEFADELPSIVGKSEENEEEEDKRILKKLKKEISNTKNKDS